MASIPLFLAAAILTTLYAGCSPAPQLDDRPDPAQESRPATTPPWPASVVPDVKIPLPAKPDPKMPGDITVTHQAPSEGPSTAAGTEWELLPVLPEFSPRARAVYSAGLTLGNDPHAFSRIGDGEIATHWFLTGFIRSPDSHDLGPFDELDETITFFAASIARESQAARAGFNTSRILDPAFADRAVCRYEESPLDCELRLNQPSFALISLGTNQVWQQEAFEAGLRRIIDILLDHSVLPILSTKGDNLEGDQRINAIVAGLAQEYGLPLWNFWRAIQPLPDHGLQPDREHLTWGPNDFSDPEALSHAWPVRNLSGLQLLHAVMIELVP
jgi:hypothetical protein